MDYAARAAAAAALIAIGVLVFMAYDYPWLAQQLSGRQAATTWPRVTPTTTAEVRTTATATYVATTTTAAPPPTLALGWEALANGTLVGSPLAQQVWEHTVPLPCSDPAVRAYLGWLGELAGQDQSLFSGNYSRMVEDALGPGALGAYRFYIGSATPLGAQPNLSECYVRVGVVELPYGVDVVITAVYSVGRVDFYVHEFVANWTQFLAMMFMVSGRISGDTSPFAYFDYLNVTTRYSGWLATEPVALWSAWELQLQADPDYYVEYRGAEVPLGTVSVIIEMPKYGWLMLEPNVSPTFGYMYGIEYAEWDLAEPAIAVAADLAYPANMTVPDLVLAAMSLSQQALGGTYISYVPQPGIQQQPLPIAGLPLQPYTTPFSFAEEGGGVCDDFALAYSAFASDALGAPTAYMVVVDYEFYDESHALTLIALPNYTGPLPPIAVHSDYWAQPDYDGEPINLTPDYLPGWVAYKLADTGAIPVSQLENWSGVTGVQPELPLLYAPPIIDTNYYVMHRAVNATFHLNYTQAYVQEVGLYAPAGVPQALLSLPAWLQTPWLREFGNLTAYYVGRYGRVMMPGCGVLAAFNGTATTSAVGVVEGVFEGSPDLWMAPGFTAAVLQLPVTAPYGGAPVTLGQLASYVNQSCKFNGFS